MGSPCKYRPCLALMTQDKHREKEGLGSGRVCEDNAETCIIFQSVPKETFSPATRPQEPALQKS